MYTAIAVLPSLRLPSLTWVVRVLLRTLPSVLRGFLQSNLLHRHLPTTSYGLIPRPSSSQNAFLRSRDVVHLDHVGLGHLVINRDGQPHHRKHGHWSCTHRSHAGGHTPWVCTCDHTRGNFQKTRKWRHSCSPWACERRTGCWSICDAGLPENSSDARACTYQPTHEWCE